MQAEGAVANVSPRRIGTAFEDFRADQRHHGYDARVKHEGDIQEGTSFPFMAADRGSNMYLHGNMIYTYPAIGGYWKGGKALVKVVVF